MDFAVIFMDISVNFLDFLVICFGFLGERIWITWWFLLDFSPSISWGPEGSKTSSPDILYKLLNRYNSPGSRDAHRGWNHFLATRAGKLARSVQLQGLYFPILLWPSSVPLGHPVRLLLCCGERANTRLCLVFPLSPHYHDGPQCFGQMVNWTIRPILLWLLS